MKTPEQVRRDHDDLLMLLHDLKLLRVGPDGTVTGMIHADTRCQKMPVPHVLTVDCTVIA